MFLSSLRLPRPGLSGCKPSGFCPDPWLALLDYLFDSCWEKRGENGGRGGEGMQLFLSWGPWKFELSHRLPQAGEDLLEADF